MIASLLAALVLLPAAHNVEHEIQKLPAPAGSLELGGALALDGDVAVSGLSILTAAPYQDAAVVFRWDGAAWVEEQVLDGGDHSPISAVSVSGDVVVCGALFDEIDGNEGQGSARVWRHVNGTWIEQAMLLATDGQPNDSFGMAVDVSGDVVVVGAPRDDFGPSSPVTDEGTVHVFRWTGSAWAKEQKLWLSDASYGERFGENLAVDGDVIVVGVPSDTSDGVYAEGSAFVFRWNGLKWNLEQKLTSSDAVDHDSFGVAVDVHDDVIVVGASQDEPPGSALTSSGSVSVFRWNGAAWLEEAKLYASDAEDSDQLGRYVGVAPHLVVAGARNDVISGFPHADSARAWRWDGSAWSGETQLIASVPAFEDLYGRVALSGDAVLIGGETGVVDADAGPVLAFDLAPPGWSWKGHALAGSAGLPVLTATGEPAAGQPITLQLLDAAPSAPTVLVAGLGLLNASFKGGILVPTPDAVIAGLATDAEGRLTLSASWPSGVPAGQLIVLQAWISDAVGPLGYAASNGIAALAQ